MKSRDMQFMRLALKEAQFSLQEDQLPVGSVVVATRSAEEGEE